MNQYPSVTKQETPPIAETERIRFHGGIIDFEHGCIEHIGSVRERLRKGEVRLLRYLYCHRGRVISRDELMKEVWGLDSKNISTRVMDVQIGEIRKKLHDSADAPKVIKTRRCFGYLFEAEA